MKVRLYVEGGAPGMFGACRQGFSAFIGKLVSPSGFRVIACGGRQRTFEMFQIAIAQHTDDLVVLLVDAKEEIDTVSPAAAEQQFAASIWAHLHEREGDRWIRPNGTKDNQAYLMVQVMESWFLADRSALATYFGKDFRLSALPRRKDIERVPKHEVISALQRAAKNTHKKSYHKTRDGFALLESIDPELVRNASPHAERLFYTLKENIL